MTLRASALFLYCYDSFEVFSVALVMYSWRRRNRLSCWVRIVITIGMTTMPPKVAHKGMKPSCTIIKTFGKKMIAKVKSRAIDRKTRRRCLVNGEQMRRNTVNMQVPVKITHMVDLTSSPYWNIEVNKDTHNIAAMTMKAPGAAWVNTLMTKFPLTRLWFGSKARKNEGIPMSKRKSMLTGWG